jgi:hypothetical protein
MVINSYCDLIDLNKKRKLKYNAWRHTINDLISNKTVKVKSVSFKNGTDFIFIMAQPSIQKSSTKSISILVLDIKWHKVLDVI